jgi:hypothetical protein
MEFLFYIWEKILGFYFENIWKSLLFWRIFSLIAFTLIILVFIYRKKLINFYLKEHHLKHDKNIFKILNSCISERDLIDCFNDLQSENGLARKSVHMIGEILLITEEEGNKYINKKIAKNFRDFIYSLDKLNSYMKKHFFPHKNIIDWYTLEPELFIYGGTDKDYKKLVDEIDKKINTVREHYKKYRSTVREILNM